MFPRLRGEEGDKPIMTFAGSFRDVHQINQKGRATMGDKGGKKGKDKSQKQSGKKQKQKEQDRFDKQPKAKPVA